MKLYELTSVYRQLSQLEDAEEFKKALDDIGDEFDLKVENIAKLIRESEAEASAYQEEAKRFGEKAGFALNRAGRLKEYVKMNMEAMGREKVQGQLLTVAIQRSPASVKITEDASIPQEYLRHIPEQWEPDKKSLLDYWKANGALPETVKGVEVNEGTHIRIR